MVNKKILGMDIGGTNLRMGLVDENPVRVRPGGNPCQAGIPVQIIRLKP